MNYFFKFADARIMVYLKDTIRNLSEEQWVDEYGWGGWVDNRLCSVMVCADTAT